MLCCLLLRDSKALETNRSLLGLVFENFVSADVDQGSFKGLRLLAEQAGDKFHRRLVIYSGSNVLMFGENLYAIPVSALWEIANGKAPKLFEVESSS